METRVAVISIIVEDGDSIEALNQRLHAAAPYIIGRMGIPYRKRGINIISVAIDAPSAGNQRPVRPDRKSARGIRENRLFLGDRSGGETMKKLAVYGKGGIGKSTTVSNVAAALAEQRL